MRIGRKLPAAVAVIGLAAGLTLVGPTSPSGAQGTLEMACAGVPGSEAEILIVNSGVFPDGYVPIPVTINSNVPADLQAGASGAVSFSWTLDPGDVLTDLAINVGTINSIDTNLMDVNIRQTGAATGGPYPFPPNTTLVLQPTESFPTITASGQVTAGDGPISYYFQIGRINLDLITAGTPQLMELDCTVLGSDGYIGGTAVNGVAPPPGGGSGGGSGSESGGASASTTIGTGTTGTASSKVTG